MSTRSTLKGYFKKGAIPTEIQFADFIDSTLNFDDDAILKNSGAPLGIKANGADEILLNFYRLDPGGNKLSWQFKQKSGLSIGSADTAGTVTNRLYIDSGTGNVGVGTNSPGTKLAVDTGGGDLPSLKLEHHGSNFIVRPLAAGSTTSVIENTGGGALLINPNNGNVGIGTLTPAYSLDIKASSIKLGLEGSGGGQLILTNNPNDNCIYFEAFSSDGASSANQMFLCGKGAVNVPKLSLCANLTAIGGSLIIKGNVGIGKENPAAKLDILAATSTWNGWMEAIQFSHDAHSAITYPKGGLLFGMHSDRHFYFADTNEGQYIMTLDANPAGGGNVGIGTINPTAKLDVFGNLAVSGGGNLSFGNQVHQMINLWGTQYGIGIQSGTQYFRTDAHFAWYRGGVHNDAELNPGGGTALMNLRNNGDMYLLGNLGTHGLPATPKTAGWGGGIHTWDVEAEGTIWSRNGTQTGARDLAENYYTDQALEAGDVVSLDCDSDGIKKTIKPNDTLVLGVISTKPGLLLNAEHGEVDNSDGKCAFPLALCGRVPCKVTDENGPINRGDFLVSSSTPGHAMKAKTVDVGNVEIHIPGTVLGKALEPLTAGKGVIEVFVLLK